jgi:hypothetical protein
MITDHSPSNKEDMSKEEKEIYTLPTIDKDSGSYTTIFKYNSVWMGSVEKSIAREIVSKMNTCEQIQHWLREHEEMIAQLRSKVVEHQKIHDIDLQELMRLRELEEAMKNIDDIRNSIIGYQSFNWSAHAYPLVAALEKAGFKGLGYEEANRMAKTQLDRIKELEAERDSLKRDVQQEVDDWEPVMTYAANNDFDINESWIPSLVLEIMKRFKASQTDKTEKI